MVIRGWKGYRNQPFQYLSGTVLWHPWRTGAKLQQSEIWKMENEFYEFALEQFQFVRAHAVREKDGELYILAQNFFYEKIYPKSN